MRQSYESRGVREYIVLGLFFSVAVSACAYETEGGDGSEARKQATLTNTPMMISECTGTAQAMVPGAVAGAGVVVWFLSPAGRGTQSVAGSGQTLVSGAGVFAVAAPVLGSAQAKALESGLQAIEQEARGQVRIAVKNSEVCWKTFAASIPFVWEALFGSSASVPTNLESRSRRGARTPEQKQTLNRLDAAFYALEQAAEQTAQCRKEHGLSPQSWIRRTRPWFVPLGRPSFRGLIQKLYDTAAFSGAKPGPTLRDLLARYRELSSQSDPRCAPPSEELVKNVACLFISYAALFSKTAAAALRAVASRQGIVCDE